MSASRQFVTWAKDHITFYRKKGAEIAAFVLPAEAEVPLFNDALRERITPEDYRSEGKDAYLRNVRIIWTKKLPYNQAWFVFTGTPVKKEPDETQNLSKA